MSLSGTASYFETQAQTWKRPWIWSGPWRSCSFEGLRGWYWVNGWDQGLGNLKNSEYQRRRLFGTLSACHFKRHDRTLLFQILGALGFGNDQLNRDAPCFTQDPLFRSQVQCFIHLNASKISATETRWLQWLLCFVCFVSSNYPFAFLLRVKVCWYWWPPALRLRGTTFVCDLQWQRWQKEWMKHQLFACLKSTVHFMHSLSFLHWLWKFENDPFRDAQAWTTFSTRKSAWRSERDPVRWIQSIIVYWILVIDFDCISSPCVFALSAFDNSKQPKSLTDLLPNASIRMCSQARPEK